MNKQLNREDWSANRPVHIVSHTLLKLTMYLVHRLMKEMAWAVDAGTFLITDHAVEENHFID